MKNVNKNIFYPPILLIVGTIIFSQVNNELFSTSIAAINIWVLNNFGFLFYYSSFGFLVILGITYFSPLAKKKIGGSEAEPLLSKGKWFAISICTTMATGILFWSCAEPLFHLTNPPLSYIEPFSEESKTAALSFLFLHWSFTPYAIYCLAGLVFALALYNMGRKFSVFSLFAINKSAKTRLLSIIVNVICLYSLVLGMASSLGGGIYSIIGGINEIVSITKSNLTIGIVGFIIILSFIISAASGLQKGIKWLSSFNIIGFSLIAVYVFLFGFPFDILHLAANSFGEYIITFIPRSLNLEASMNQEWMKDWSIFYLANWFAWAPIAALFLGKISKGYTVRDYINFNLILPALFAIIWMTIFGGTPLHLNKLLDNALYLNLEKEGVESVMYGLFDALSFAKITIPFVVILLFLSYVTAADSNISAMASLSENNFDSSNGESSVILKIIWGLVLGSLTYIMLATKGLDGIKILSVLGGFPALFIVIGAAITLLRILLKKVKLE